MAHLYWVGQLSLVATRKTEIGNQRIYHVLSLHAISPCESFMNPGIGTSQSFRLKRASIPIKIQFFWAFLLYNSSRLRLKLFGCTKQQEIPIWKLFHQNIYKLWSHIVTVRKDIVCIVFGGGKNVPMVCVPPRPTKSSTSPWSNRTRIVEEKEDVYPSSVHHKWKHRPNSHSSCFHNIS